MASRCRSRPEPAARIRQHRASTGQQGDHGDSRDNRDPPIESTGTYQSGTLVRQPSAQPVGAVNTSAPNVAGTVAASARRGTPSRVSQLANEE